MSAVAKTLNFLLMIDLLLSWFDPR